MPREIVLMGVEFPAILFIFVVGLGLYWFVFQWLFARTRIEHFLWRPGLFHIALYGSLFSLFTLWYYRP